MEVLTSETENREDLSPDVVDSQTWDEAINQYQSTDQALSLPKTMGTSSGSPTVSTTVVTQIGSDLKSSNFTPGVSGWRLGSNGVIESVGIKSKSSSTATNGGNGVVMDEDGIRGYSATLGEVFNLPTDGSAPSFSSGTITSTTFEVDTSSVIRTSSTVGDGTANSAGMLMNNTGLYGCLANQTLESGTIRLRNTGTFFVGSSSNYMNWDGEYLRIKGSLDVGDNGVINNAVYTVANLPVVPTSSSFTAPTANSAY